MALSDKPVYASEALTSDAFRRTLSPFYINNAQPGSIALAVFKLCQISVNVFLGAMLVDALQAAFRNRNAPLEHNTNNSSILASCSAGDGSWDFCRKPIGLRYSLRLDRYLFPG